MDVMGKAPRWKCGLEINHGKPLDFTVRSWPRPQSLLFLAVSAGHDVELRLGDAATVGTAQGTAEVVTLCLVRNFNAGAPEHERGP